MKYLKTYEDVNKPEVGDYVIVSVQQKYSNYKPMNVIGQIYDMKEQEFIPTYYSVKYTLPDGKTSHEIFYNYHIKEFSKNKEDLEYILNANKYNL